MGRTDYGTGEYDEYLNLTNQPTMRTIPLTFLLLLSMYAMSQEIRENILDNQTYKERMAYFEANPLKEGQIVFLGNSLTQGGKWDEYFPAKQPANRGIAGDNTLGMLNRLTEILEARPEKLFLLAGINDISLNRPNDKIMTGLKAIIYQVQAASPDTEILVQSLLPINNDNNRYKRMLDKEKQIEKLNMEIQKFCKAEGITFINLYPAFLSGKRKLNAKYTTDGLHLNDAGYAVWASQIQSYIK
ncbi:lysophospholipase L1-like esterase [Dysgonomonas sp. PFB1-18]|uniref:GDSL-type esterase/lipase family protein n=1 Tax=unclassified Dysgonomonas TaxID=2630389 RepID=UPI00247489C9|nr:MULTISPECIES: GDSL-type esterase/lipase family protein [unclassified Dysgonomonas]MDH6308645.1 lysophospholipase L1-like esterase [Dysgonomonas sp. PF1-14]MDH6338146.1 lysophospholipase L1-like esterase [Dysgonomonas sp. PF1-16]MDH6379643.1 lysophospholipase L1-like esterase [Dysgonomonas sp. PFB1-18]MDH6396973.1 lysophospholipase L1-like esterase [Dysgonomonas sp. PF1-23]